MNKCPTCSTDSRSVYHADNPCPRVSQVGGLSFVRKRSVGSKMYKGGKFIGYVKDYSPTGSPLPSRGDG